VSEVVLVAVPVVGTIAEDDLGPIAEPMDTYMVLGSALPLRVAVVICIPVNVSETDVPSNVYDPVFEAEVRVRTPELMLPTLNKTLPSMNASDFPDKGVVAVPVESAKYILIVPPAATVTVDMKVITKGWQMVVLA